MSGQRSVDRKMDSVIAGPRKVNEVDPLMYARKIISSATGQAEFKLDLDYKRLWFRLTCPHGKMLLNPLRITDQIAMFEAQIYLNQNDPGPIANFTAAALACDTPNGQYVRAAQDEALSEALNNAGFDIRCCVFNEPANDLGVAGVLPQSEGKAHASEQDTGTTVNANTTDADALDATTEKQVASLSVTEQPNPEAPETPSDKSEKTSTCQADSGESAPQPAKSPLILQRLADLGEKDSPSAEDVVKADEEKAVGETPSTESTSLEDKYPDSMTVEEIMAQITVEEAKTVVVGFGTCRGLSLGEVMQNRPASLRYLVYATIPASNLLKAAATVLLNELSQRIAG